MAKYLLRRILLFLPTILGATFLVFMLMALSPISIIDALLPPGGDIRPGERAVKRAYLEERYGLKQPPAMQYLRWLNNISPVGFGKWHKDDPEVVAATDREKQLRDARRAELVAQGTPPLEADRIVEDIDVAPNPGTPRLSRPRFKSPEMGYSYIQSRPVSEMLKEALPVTLTIQLIALPTAVSIALLSGIWAARHRGGLWDVGSGTILLAIYSLPVIWVGVMFIGFLANVEYVKAFPAAGLHDVTSSRMSFFPSFNESGFQRGYLLDSAWHIALPIICVGYGAVAYYSKLTRTSMLETLSSDFVRTARAKGLGERVVLFRHALRNSLIPLITVAASFLPLLVTGSIVVETIFSINGMGRLVIESLYRNDRELFLGVSVTVLILQLLGFLLADILYVIADPRVSYDA
jgi:ABC-type dipeptide/oligopeptide/nickel transport system permease component